MESAGLRCRGPVLARNRVRLVASASVRADACSRPATYARHPAGSSDCGCRLLSEHHIGRPRRGRPCDAGVRVTASLDSLAQLELVCRAVFRTWILGLQLRSYSTCTGTVDHDFT